jgi:hypothetical protein
MSQVTRQHFALNYSGNDASLPPPLCFTVPAKNRAPRQGGLVRGGVNPIRPSAPNVMMEPSDPATWQRPYQFTV